MSQIVHGDRDTATALPRAGGGGMAERLWRRRLVAAIVWGACVLAGFLYLVFAPSVFESTATLSAANPSDGSSPPTPDALFDQVGVIKSADVASDAIHQADLQNLPTLRGQSDPIGFMMRSLDVQVRKASLEIQVGMPARSADDSFKITNGVVGAFLTRQTAAQSAQHTGQQATDASLHVIDTRRDSALLALLQFKQANPAFITADSADALGKRIAKLNDDLAQAQSEAAQARAEFQADKSKLTDPQQSALLVHLARPKAIFGALDEQGDDVEGQLGPLLKTLAQQRQTLGAQNPIVMKTQTQIDGLKAREAEIVDQKAVVLANYLQHQIDLADAQVKALRDQLADEESEARNYASKQIEFQKLQNASQAADAAATDADQRAREVQALGGSAAMLTLTNPAHPESRPAWPQPVPVLATSLVVGLFLALAAGVVPWGVE